MMYLLDLYDILMNICSKNVVCGYMMYNTFLFYFCIELDVYFFEVVFFVIEFVKCFIKMDEEQ